MSRTSNSQALREDYLRWLEPQLKDGHGNNQDKTYWDLINLMFDTKFEYDLPMDENRVVDGKNLRTEFANFLGGSDRRRTQTADALLNLAPVSFLEVLIGLSRRMAFNAGGEAPGWAWHLVCNLELDRMWDPITRPKTRRAQEVMNAVIQRVYLPDGTGGFFPLAWPDDDQTRIELWYQMHNYIGELHPEFR